MCSGLGTQWEMQLLNWIFIESPLNKTVQCIDLGAKRKK